MKLISTSLGMVNRCKKKKEQESNIGVVRGKIGLWLLGVLGPGTQRSAGARQQGHGLVVWLQPALNISLHCWQAGHLSTALWTICQWQLNNFLIMFTEGGEQRFFPSISLSKRQVPVCSVILCWCDLLPASLLYGLCKGFLINSENLLGCFQIAKERAKLGSLIVWRIYWDLCTLIITPSSSAMLLFTLNRGLCTAHASTIKIKTTYICFPCCLSSSLAIHPSRPESWEKNLAGQKKGVAILI